MKKSLIFSALALFFAVNVVADPPANYYNSLENLSGKALFDAVHAVAKVGYSSLSYSDLWTAYGKTDLKANGKIWDMYSNCEFTYISNQCGSYSDVCTCYNREHSIPKSWFGSSESANTPGTDIFHIVPTDGKVNGMRDNNAFGESPSGTIWGTGKLGNSVAVTTKNTIVGATTTQDPNARVFEPADEYKGDFARGYFGTMVRWANGDYQKFTSGDGAKIFSTDYTADKNYGLTDYGVALLMKWHRQDPVSQKERDRNDGIQQTQGNRNPFIDIPDLAEYIWGNKAGQIYASASSGDSGDTGSGDSGDSGSGDTGGEGGDIGDDTGGDTGDTGDTLNLTTHYAASRTITIVGMQAGNGIVIRSSDNSVLYSKENCGTSESYTFAAAGTYTLTINIGTTSTTIRIVVP